MFFLEITSTQLGLYLCPYCGPAYTPGELLVREDGVHHRRRSLQGILPLRDFRLATAMLYSSKGFSEVCKDLPLPFHTVYSSGFSLLLKMTDNMGDSLHAHLEPFSVCSVKYASQDEYILISQFNSWGLYVQLMFLSLFPHEEVLPAHCL